MSIWRLPRIRIGAFAVLRRNVLVWRKLIIPALLMNFGEPALYLLGLGFGLGQFVGEMDGMPYLAFLASGIIASSAMTTATFEGMYSVFTRMVPQRTYEAILATPLEGRHPRR
jgi:lipooligosaccharide transport system permease protein